jgi:hypothetical protein
MVIAAEQLRAGDIVEYGGAPHLIAEIRRPCRAARPMAVDRHAWAIALGSQLLRVERRRPLRCSQPDPARRHPLPGLPGRPVVLLAPGPTPRQHRDEMAEMLVESLTAELDPANYEDDLRVQVLDLIAKKAVRDQFELHLPAVIALTAVTGIGADCPLTVLENPSANAPAGTDSRGHRSNGRISERARLWPVLTA